MAWCALQGKYDMLSLRVRLKPPCLNDIKLIVIAVRWPKFVDRQMNDELLCPFGCVPRLYHTFAGRKEQGVPTCQPVNMLAR